MLNLIDFVDKTCNTKNMQVVVNTIGAHIKQCVIKSFVLQNQR